MPVNEKQRKFNKNLISDWKRAAGKVVSHPAFAMPAIIGTVFTVIFSPVIVRELAKKADNKYRSHEIDGVRYTLDDAHLVSTLEDAKVNYHINYRTGAVEYDRYKDGKEPSFHFFKDFTDASVVDESFLEEARQAGLVVADRIIEEYESLDEAQREKWDKDDDQADKIEDARIFKERYSDEDALRKMLSAHENDADAAQNQMPKLKPL